LGTKKSLAHGQVSTKFSLARLEKSLAGVGQWDLSALVTMQNVYASIQNPLTSDLMYKAGRIGKYFDRRNLVTVENWGRWDMHDHYDMQASEEQCITLLIHAISPPTIHNNNYIH
jgi:hypothetical protein